MRSHQTDEALPDIHPIVSASDQVARALNALDRPAQSFVRWPFPELDALTGPMAPGNVWFVCATSGGGKTTFITSVIDQWVQGGRRVYVMPLETKDYEFRTYLACIAADIPPGDVLSGDFATFPNYTALRSTLGEHFKAHTSEPMVSRLMVSGVRAINLEGLTQGLKEAKKFKANVVIVDHIDHIEGGNGSNLFSEAKRVNDEALRMAQDNDLLLVFTSQLKQSAGAGDHLTKYAPPRVDQIAFGSLKQRNATGMIGLYRPLRTRRSDETEDEYAKSLRAARAGNADAPTALEPNTMGVVAMKLRNFGSREGARINLGVRHGRVLPLSEKDHYSTNNGMAWSHK